MLRMEQLGDWLVVEKLFRQVTDLTRFFAIGREVKHYVYVKQVIAVPVRSRREKIALCDVLSMTTETYTSHLFRSDKKSEFILIARFTLPLAS